MSNVVITPAPLNGEVTVPPSKSAVHRAVLCAAMAKGVSKIHNVELSNDIQATVNCVRALGAEVKADGDTLIIDGSRLFCNKQAALDCGESGSTLRFLIPIAAAGAAHACFTGCGRLPQRPIGIYLDCLPKAGVSLQTQGGLPLTVSGALKSGTFTLPGNVSSQFITGLLLSLPLLDGDSKIILSSPLESAGYIDMTIEIMSDFGVQITHTESGYHIKGNQRYCPREYTCEGDWSQAAFFLAAGALGGQVTVHGLNLASSQGDRACAELFARFGAQITFGSGSVTATALPLHAVKIDARQIPDLVPILAVTAAFAEGTTVIEGAGRLRIKESDRLNAITQGLGAFGAQIEETEDGLVIMGVPSLRGGLAEGFNDHRIVMALAVAAIKASGTVTITDRESIKKSYPSFFTDYNRLGGRAAWTQPGK